MSKYLFLIRHANAVEKTAGTEDRDKPLSLEGIQNASKMGRFFVHKNMSPDLIFCSPAIRARTTAELIAEQINYDTRKIHINDQIYEASLRTLMQVVNLFKDEYKTIFLVGHNPSITFMSEYITGEEIGDVKACGVVRVRFKIRFWEEVSSGIGEMLGYEYPEIIEI